MSFSKRQGLTPVVKFAQRESIDDEFRNSLWTVLTQGYWSQYKTVYSNVG